MQHGHSHGEIKQHSNEDGDIYTILTTLIGGAADMLGSYYYFAELVGLLDGSEDSDSTTARVVGSLATTTALVSMYTHYQLYVFHQQRSEPAKKPAIQPVEEVVISINATPTHQHVISTLKALHQHAHQTTGKPHSPSTQPLLAHEAKSDQQAPKKPQLSILQNVALTMDAVTHIAGIAGALAAPINILWKNLGYWTKVGVHVGTFAAGALGSIAQVRNERNVLQQQAINKRALAENLSHEDPASLTR